MDYVLDHPFGVGVGRAKEERIEATGDVVASDVKVISRTWYARCLESFNSGITPLVLFLKINLIYIY
jgi:hypothetical protein